MKLLNLVKENDKYNVFFENGVFMGEFIMLEDGYFRFWPDCSKGGSNCL